MRAVLVVAKAYMGQVNQILDQQNVQIVAIVTDDRIFASEHGCPKEMTFAFWQFKDVVAKFSPDYILFFTPGGHAVFSFQNELSELGIPLSKMCVLSDYANVESTETISVLNTFEKTRQKYRVIVSGNSYMQNGIVPEEFELPIYSFARQSQDLYFDFKIFKCAFGISEQFVDKIGLDTHIAPPPRIFCQHSI